MRMLDVHRCPDRLILHRAGSARSPAILPCPHAGKDLVDLGDEPKLTLAPWLGRFRVTRYLLGCGGVRRTATATTPILSSPAPFPDTSGRMYSWKPAPWLFCSWRLSSYVSLQSARNSSILGANSRALLFIHFLDY